MKWIVGSLAMAATLAAGSAFLVHRSFAADGPDGLPPIEYLKDYGLTPALADLAYGAISSAQKLDIYLPEKADAPPPVVLFIHGGGFRFGDKASSIPPIVKGLVDGGFAVATVNYRLSTEATFPAAPEDIGRAIEFLRANAKAYGVDGKRLVVMGESAGANLASLAATAFAAPLMRAGLTDPASDIRPIGAVTLFPPIDFLQLDKLLAEQGCKADHGSADSFESVYLGGPIAAVPDKAKAASPLSYISQATPPFFVENGSADCMVGTKQSQLLVAALKKESIPVDYTLIDGAGHGGKPFETAENVAKIVSWTTKLVSSNQTDR